MENKNNNLFGKKRRVIYVRIQRERSEKKKNRMAEKRQTRETKLRYTDVEQKNT